MIRASPMREGMDPPPVRSKPPRARLSLAAALRAGMLVISRELSGKQRMPRARPARLVERNPVGLVAPQGRCMASARTIRLAVDIGGTFTDVALEALGGRVTAKVLTTPQAPERGVMEGVTAAVAKAGCGLGDIALIIHGTTLATNALIERKGAVTALITTEGFRDAVEIGYEHRFEQYDIYLEKPEAARAAPPALHRAGTDECARRRAAGARRTCGGGVDSRAAARGGEQRRCRPAAQLCQSGTRAARPGDPARAIARRAGEPVVGGFAGAARVRAAVDRVRECLRATADGRLSRSARPSGAQAPGLADSSCS